MKQRLNNLLHVTPLKITLFVILLALLLFFIDPPFLRFMELKTLDLRMASRGMMPPGEETVIAAIDEKSLKEFGRWPWSRTVLAKLVDKLKADDVKAIGFDIVFSEPDDNSSLKTIAELTSEMKQSGIRDSNFLSLLNKKRAVADTDAAFAKSIARAQNVTLGYFFHFLEKNREVVKMAEKEITENTKSIQNSRYQIINSSAQNPDDSRLPHAQAPETNIKTIAVAAQNSGYFNTIPDSDGSNRWSPLVIKYEKNYYTSLAISLLMQYLDSPSLVLNLEEFGVESIKIGDISIPTDDRGRLLINYLGPGRTFPHYSIADIMQGKIPAEKLRGKIVLVGATAIGIYDLRVTPFGSP